MKGKTNRIPEMLSVEQFNAKAAVRLRNINNAGQDWQPVPYE